MNGLEQLLQDDLNHLIDCIAATTNEGTVAECTGEHPELVARIRDAESRLSVARQGLLQGYAAWQDLLGECRDLWALADLVAAPPTPAERYAA